jgi:ATP-dependent DNA helicase DinG
MSEVENLIHRAFANLTDKPGFVPRENQVQLALILSDLISTSSSGAVEAPTGLGKSLAALIPALAHAIVHGKRIVIATYTNVLAEQYWRKDLPLALKLFEQESPVRTAFLIGRQRYACLIGLDEAMPQEVERFREYAELGTEAEFREFARKPNAEMGQRWSRVATPPVCPARLCPAFDDCYFYAARRKAERAEIVITNHSVVIQDALNARHSDESVGMLGAYDFLIVDEAHDFVASAQSGLEFDLSVTELNMLKGMAGRVENSLKPTAEAVGQLSYLLQRCESFRKDIDHVSQELVAYGLSMQQGGILTTSPLDLMDHPQLQRQKAQRGTEEAARIAGAVNDACSAFVDDLQRSIQSWESYRSDEVRLAKETVRNYLQYILEIGAESKFLLSPEGVMVSYVQSTGSSVGLRSDTVGLAEPLDELIWSRKPFAMLSATLATDGDFDFMKRTLGIKPDFDEILPSPFDFSTQAAVYVPKESRIPDPSLARAQGTEEVYYNALAREVAAIIEAVDGRTLVLFHSRKEMEAVKDRIILSDDLPIYVQSRMGASTVGDRFRSNIRSSLFAVRSFWTGFDAPGETCSCVILVRVPFEVPIDPPAVARMAHLQQLGLNPFESWTLPMAKMMIRQGAGRLIRSSEDKGIIALLDPRLRTKRYGEEILANLPSDMRTFDDIGDAVGWIGLEPYAERT